MELGYVRCSTLLCTALAWQLAVQAVERIYQALMNEKIQRGAAAGDTGR
jgi:hypothetical protein